MNPAEAEEDERCCKICQGTRAFTEPLLSPCKCSGTIEYVHESCLQEWLNTKNADEKPRCEVCSTEYRFQNVHDLRLVTLTKIWHMLQTCMTTAYKSRAARITYILVCVLFMQCYSHTSTVLWWYDGRKALEDLSIDGLRDFGLTSLYQLCVMLCFIPIAIATKWSSTAAQDQRDKVRVDPIVSTNLFVQQSNTFCPCRNTS